MNNDTVMTSTDTARFDAAKAGTIFDPRADIDADGDQGGSLKGDVDSTDQTLFDNKKPTWDPLETPPVPGQPFSDVGNPYQFQGVPHFALDSGAFGLAAKLLLNHHRARFADPVIGRRTTRDPLSYCIECAQSDAQAHASIDSAHMMYTSARVRPSASLSRSLMMATKQESQALLDHFAYLDCNAVDHTDATGLSTSKLCGLTYCNCPKGSRTVRVYETSERARVIFGSQGNGCVTWPPDGIYCTMQCYDIKNSTADDNITPILDHECCHWCDWSDHCTDIEFWWGAILDTCNARSVPSAPMF